MAERCYSGTSKTQPTKNSSGGFGNYCCIPNCKSAFYNSRREKTGITLFQLPSKDNERKKWIKIISNFRRSGPRDNFDSSNKNKRIFVCEFHFKPDEIRVTLGVGRKKLLPGAIPSIFDFKETRNAKKRKSPKKRISLNVQEKSSESSEIEEELLCVDPNYVLPPELTETELLKVEIQNLKERIKQLDEENDLLKAENIELKTKHVYSYKTISENSKHFKKATGIERDVFLYLLDLLDPGEDCKNLKMYDTSKRLSEEKFTTLSNETDMLKSGPKPKLNPIDQFFMYITWLRNGFSLQHVSWLFNVSIATSSRYLITWTNFCYFKLGSINIWPTRDQVNFYMPDCFKRAYPSTRCIIDCTELFCQRPSSLATQSSLYSHYKSHVTYKGLVGISPAGSITFISQLFDGSISDKEIVCRSGLLEQTLWDKGDSVMADRGFTIEEELNELNVKLNIPCFLSGRDQFTVAEVKESQAIASVRIHVERAIQRIKRYRILRNEMPLTLHGSVNQIWTVCCMLCNFMPPLIQKDYSNTNSNGE